eukprot:1152598-Pelagomonas_calceolata.AAC.7
MHIHTPCSILKASVAEDALCQGLITVVNAPFLEPMQGVVEGWLVSGMLKFVDEAMWRTGLVITIIHNPLPFTPLLIAKHFPMGFFN